ncbi:PIN domain-containing protein [Vagococcus sp. BWB3-3]|uniref:PIN domain-containing protein n=1 Tax=Vagococcus allomyrinae TaxID=2794353 RepID=A0A940PGL0_9ENTE|nr:PIN domain-containing protein [Vagococcus allomyrinae]MBP1043563.1 PIN domain-containing protein [Vagococcus allomyrinae]
MKVLIDINIVLDYLFRRDEVTYRNAKDIYLASVYGVIQGVVTANMVTDIFYLIEKYQGKEKAKIEIEKLIKTMAILPVDKEDCLNALREEMSDYEDALAVACSKRYGIDLVVTRNAKDFEKSGLIVYKPEEFLERIKSN